MLNMKRHTWIYISLGVVVLGLAVVIILARNVLATAWEPVVDAGVVSGLRVRLLEVFGRPAKAALSTFRPVTSARKTDFQGQPAGDCPIEAGRVQVQLSAHEWIQVEACW